jgi:hypothetical protein
MKSVTKQSTSDGTSRLSRRLAHNAVMRALSGLISADGAVDNMNGFGGNSDDINALLKMTEAARVMDVNHDDMRKRQTVNTTVSNGSAVGESNMWDNTLLPRLSSDIAPNDQLQDANNMMNLFDLNGDSTLLSYLQSLTSTDERSWNQNIDPVEGLTAGLFPALSPMHRNWQ